MLNEPVEACFAPIAPISGRGIGISFLSFSLNFVHLISSSQKNG
jgi:hypothetical protein